MPTVRLTETHVQGVYRGSDGGVYARVDGTEGRCGRCRRWAQTLYHRSSVGVCERHIRLTDRTRVRLTTTFACRVYRAGVVGVPAATVMRRGDQLAVAGRPEPHGRFDKFVLADGGGFVLLPRSRWAWV